MWMVWACPMQTWLLHPPGIPSLVLTRPLDGEGNTRDLADLAEI